MVFRPPFEEFEIQLVEVPAGETVPAPTNPGPLLLLVTRGAGSAAASGGAAASSKLLAQAELRRGSVAFVPAGTTIKYTASGAGDLQVWAAAVNAKVFAPATAEEAAAAAEPALVAA
ncbi:hypothetical protein MNEG_16367 [Monoraphidium neglectum]|uniref:Mannose-6-phosphate isomerase n=1 Tax=Monoraphidium neglectum TaxID=145388 RepID=A0A0D2K625_9CHLO|nr:hypothetical protein MNEG_16367 [Monoraphidium neglectum]KIY91598.1 hypothetical protein MNEG_16367 [Monoraphidium neglectum]|eukprot:XP_013890618.1 hypothetical protein MNEG_16367 [Monoraphidium neglectum]